MNQESFIEAVATELMEDATAINLETKLEDLDGWDSLSMVGIVAMVDKKYGVVIDGESLRNLKTVGDIYAQITE